MPEELVTEVKAADTAKITAAFEAEQDKLFSTMNVVGMGVGTNVKGGVDTGEPCVKVLVSQKLPLDLLTEGDKIDPKVGDYDTDVEEVGELFAGFNGEPDQKIATVEGREVNVLDGEEIHTFVDQEAGIQLLRQRVRPVEGGYSVGHYRITAGTYATAVYDRSPYPGIPRRYYALSNNHVLANSNNARIGDPILQPGPYDGGKYPGDMIARLSRFVRIKFDGTCNYVDAAVAEGPFHWLDREVYWIGYVKGVRREWPQIGEILQKTGRTTNYTTGKVKAINATVNVNYGGGQVGRFCRQIVTANMSAGGDSGSVVLDRNENAIGLLFAGSSVSTIMNHIVYVEYLLAIRVV